MKTNDLKKGDRVRLANGWEAEITDNLKGNTRLAKVFGVATEIGSVYSHDIVEWLDTTIVQYVSGNTDAPAPNWLPIEHTPAQIKLRAAVKSFGLP